MRYTIVPKTAPRTTHICAKVITIMICDEIRIYYVSKRMEIHDIITIKNTIEPVAKPRMALDHTGKYGSFSFVTGFIRNVLTDVSNSGLGSSSYSAF